LLDFSTLDFVGLSLVFFERDGYRNGYSFRSEPQPENGISFSVADCSLKLVIKGY
jgi:hypothetical protein